jgi:hypothetical protein
MAAYGKNPLVKIPPADIALLAADVAKRQLWADHVLILPLRWVSGVLGMLATKSHLAR